MMQFNENLIRLRKSRGWSQEELGYKVDVSRQTVSKWETGDTTPEMGKLVKLSGIFNISMDALISGEESASGNAVGNRLPGTYEFKSRKTIGGIPLVHINIGRGLKIARGIVAIGNISMGVLSIGILSLGLFSLGLITAGLLAAGCLSIGGIAAGGLSAGYIALGGVASGYLAIGGVARGIYAFGGVSLARDIAVGGVAHATIAVGKSVQGTVEFVTENNFSDIDPLAVRSAIEAHLPGTPQWILNLLSGF